MTSTKKSIEIGGKTLTLETGGFAMQADGAVLVRYGDTEILATVVEGGKKEDQNFLPLSVDYIERLYAGGRIKGSRWVKREGKPPDNSVLIGRLVDRSVRPLFPHDYYREVQVIITVLSVDMENNPDILSVIGVAAALGISPIPWNGPLAAVRVGLKDGKNIILPTYVDMNTSDLDLVISCTENKVDMIEAGANQVTEEKFLEALTFGRQECAKILDFLAEFAKEVGKPKKEHEKAEIDTTSMEKVEKEILKNKDLLFYKGDFGETKAAIIESFPEEERRNIAKVFDDVFKKIIRKDTLAGKRYDGRKVDEVRSLSMEVGLLPRTHGSALFTRGQSQVLTAATLAGPSLEQLIESAEGEVSKRYLHHYNMAPYASGECGRMSTSRREIGHGDLAERALIPAIPPSEKFPYTIHLVSEVLSSNGSTSMASTCASTLALMDAGVPISEMVSGIAMGLMTTDDGKDYVILTDLAGIEDFNGDMDFKIAGTKNGMTAIQLDSKIGGLTEKQVKETLEKAKIARLFILEKMTQCLSAPREKLSQYAPRVVIIKIDPEKIGEVIGPGGKMIRRIIAETGAMVEVDDDGSVNISGSDDASVQKAVDTITGLTKDVKPGEVYDGVVKRIQPFGAFVEILPGKDGLVHVSQMAQGFVSNPSDVVTIGQTVKVKVMEIDELKRINLTMILDGEKAVTRQTPAEKPEFSRPPRRPFPPRRPSW
jgi:polyribonucleotide nucleotidyltransferase